MSWMAEEADATQRADERETSDGRREYRCSAGEKCLHGGKLMDWPGIGSMGRSDRYRIYAGKWHDGCWEKFGYAGFEFDESYAGERLEEDY